MAHASDMQGLLGCTEVGYENVSCCSVRFCAEQKRIACGELVKEGGVGVHCCLLLSHSPHLLYGALLGFL
jgi:hypothetical protein